MTLFYSHWQSASIRAKHVTLRTAFHVSHVGVTLMILSIWCFTRMEAPDASLFAILVIQRTVIRKSTVKSATNHAQLARIIVRKEIFKIVLTARRPIDSDSPWLKRVWVNVKVACFSRRILLVAFAKHLVWAAQDQNQTAQHVTQMALFLTYSTISA